MSSKREIGRPVEMKDNPRRRGTNYSFYLSEDQIQKLEEARWRERKSQSEIVREAIDDWLRSHSEGNSTFKLDKWQEDPEFKAVPTLLSSHEKWNKFLLENCSEEDITKIRIAANFITKTIDHKKTNDYWDNYHKVGGWRVKPNNNLPPKHAKILPNIINNNKNSSEEEIIYQDEEEIITE